MLLPTKTSDTVKTYYKLQTKLKEKFPEDNYVVINPKTGKYFVAETSVDAMKKARAAYPKAKLFLAQVGRVAGFMK